MERTLRKENFAGILNGHEIKHRKKITSIILFKKSMTNQINRYYINVHKDFILTALEEISN